MVKEDILIDYDEEEDLLALSFASQKVKFSFYIELPNGDFIINYGFDGRIVGLEFSNASSFFPKIKDINIDKAKAKINVKYGRGWAQIFYCIIAENIQQNIQGIIPVPYNREMILEK